MNIGMFRLISGQVRSWLMHAEKGLFGPWGEGLETRKIVHFKEHAKNKSGA